MDQRNVFVKCKCLPLSPRTTASGLSACTNLRHERRGGRALAQEFGAVLGHLVVSLKAQHDLRQHIRRDAAAFHERRERARCPLGEALLGHWLAAAAATVACTIASIRRAQP